MKNKEEFDTKQAEVQQEGSEDGVLVESPTNDSASTTTTTSTTSMSSSAKAARALIGKNVKTLFGQGIVLEYRNDDRMFVIKLTTEASFAPLAILYTKIVPERYETPSEKADELNVAYEALEKMRRMNLEVMCHEIGIYEEIDHGYCTTCLLDNKAGKSHFPRLQRLMDQAATTDLESFPRLHRLFHSTYGNIHEEKLNDTDNKGANESTTVTEEPTEINSAEQSSGSNDASNELTRSSTSATQAPSSTTQGQLLQQAMAKQKSTKEEASTSFPRLRSVWGSIQNMPQPAAAQRAAVSSNSPVAADTEQIQQGEQSAIKPAATSFPRIRGFLDSSGATDMFSSMTINTSASSKPQSPSSTESTTNFPRLKGVFDTTGTSSMFSSFSTSQKPAAKSSSNTSRTAKSEKPKALPRIQKLIDQRQKANTSPCLICASPSCSAHSSANFRREGITLCLQCEKLFELNFIIDCISSSDPSERANHIDHMIDCYDRCMLLLEYSSQFVDQIATALEDQKERQNKVGLASSSVGVLSGVLGIAAAASILTPAGPPLLIASLFFGGGATTVQTGTEAMNYFSEPRKLADRVIALHGMALSLLRVTSTLRDAMMRDHIRTDVYAAEPVPLKDQVQEQLEKNRVAVLAGSNVGRSVALGGVAGAEAAGVGAAGAVAAGAASEMGAAGAAAGAAGARSATAISRAGTAAARTVRFARFAGGALSAAVLVLEANAIQSTLKSIHDGSPCDKADTLRRVVQEIQDFPTSSELDSECQAYLEVLANRPPSPPVAEASAVPDFLPAEANIPEATCQEVTGEYQLCAPGAVIVDGDATDTQTTMRSAPSPNATSSPLRGSSFVERIQERQELRQHMAISRTEEVVAVAVDDAQLGESGINLVL